MKRNIKDTLLLYIILYFIVASFIITFPPTAITC